MKTINDLLLAVSTEDEKFFIETSVPNDVNKDIGVFINTSRRNGKTTRLIDETIQCLFKHKKLILGYSHTTASTFHDPDSYHNDSVQRSFVDKVLIRLHSEHTDKYVTTITSVNCTITII